jgi:hypothetical protein
LRQRRLRQLRIVALADACYRQALDEAVLAVHDERLSALHRAQRGTGAT